MAQLRILSDNLADVATVTATPTPVVGLGLGNLKTDIKSQVCRFMSDTVEIEANWSEGQSIGCVGIPTCNLSQDSTIQVQVYDGLDLVHDSGELYAAPGIILDNWDFTQELNINAFWDGPATVGVWFDHVYGDRVVVTINDPLVDHIDISRLVIGPYFEPVYNPAYGSSFGIEDLTRNTRAESGDIKTYSGTKHRVLTLDMGWVFKADRHRFAHIMRQGIGKRHFVSVNDGSAQVGKVQDWMLYGVLRQVADMAYIAPGLHQTQFQIQEW